MNRITRNLIFYFVIFLVIISAMELITGQANRTEEFKLNEFMEVLDNEEVESMEMRPANGVMRITGILDNKDKTEFITNIPDNPDIVANITLKAANQGLSIQEEEQPSPWLSFLMTIAPFIIIVIIFIFLMNQSQGGGNKVMNFGKSKAKMYNEDKKKVSFNEVAGADEEKQELIEVVDFLKDPRKFTAIGAKIPKGMLLVGPPGTGKTLLARAVAGEAGVPFFSISGSDFVEMFVGVGASRVRDLFENAKKNAPCIVFIDEIDAVGRQRGAGVGGGHDEREQTLNQLLVEMDGFGDNEGVIIMAATNRADILDPALLRPGRFDRQIMVDRPDLKGREAILKVHARNKPLSEDISLETIAMRTPGFSGADLENLLNEAALVAARSDKKQIEPEDIDEATDRVIAGPAKKSRVISEKERNIVAYHESGHTIIGLVLDEADFVHKVTIVPRGQAGGYAVMLPREDRYFMTKPELLAKVTGLLGGRVAEEIIFNEVSTGAHNDFQRATNIVRKMVTEYGMSDKIGPLQFNGSNDQVFLGRDMQSEAGYSDAIAYEIDQEMQNMINECYDRAKEILTEHKDKLELIAQTLLKVETLDAKQIKSLFDTGRLPGDVISEQDGEFETNSNNQENSEDVKVTIQAKDEAEKED
ncbi:ATP-dependent zinc metalloprotease FtsH [Amphibacillus sp. MSJ-3]|uniref:ATP-dependent zinc metalloprotease FtsH n=1 Tax=Amphibacillus sp. MSJ-3 TaxID=2841505 RepID=UPI001C0F2ED9|nr:ATP-dependent zinc metalloprotease FtsH [Amphibacillus sp. MSJ-3]MBU5595515.1 ATP-dependent zinc metalloprotease FtsH [Amphibacillus sp. MSJ-3]